MKEITEEAVHTAPPFTVLPILVHGRKGLVLAMDPDDVTCPDCIAKTAKVRHRGEDPKMAFVPGREFTFGKGTYVPRKKKEEAK